MEKFRKKPVVIEAVQNIAKNALELSNLQSSTRDITYNSVLGEVSIKTLEGTMVANTGDWIIKGINGEYYPCKPDIFEKTYEAVTE